MGVYAIGDVQGCLDELSALLDALSFDPASDRIWFVGDLVNRGPKSLETLRYVRQLGDAAICVLGNHDLHLLALALTEESPVTAGNLVTVLEADDADELVGWLRTRPLAHFDPALNTLLLHAGTIPAWSVDDILARAGEVEAALADSQAHEFLSAMYGRKPDQWSARLTGTDRLRFISNCLTRIRYCTAAGRLDFDNKLAPGTQPPGLRPWFEQPGRATANTRIVFGHWSTLGLIHTDQLLALDTGCVWGGKLTAMRLDIDAAPLQIPSQQPRPEL